MDLTRLLITREHVVELLPIMRLSAEQEARLLALHYPVEFSEAAAAFDSVGLTWARSPTGWVEAPDRRQARRGDRPRAITLAQRPAGRSRMAATASCWLSRAPAANA
jgi:hypothetical protein